MYSTPVSNNTISCYIVMTRVRLVWISFNCRIKRFIFSVHGLPDFCKDQLYPMTLYTVRSVLTNCWYVVGISMADKCWKRQPNSEQCSSCIFQSLPNFHSHIRTGKEALIPAWNILLLHRYHQWSVNIFKVDLEQRVGAVGRSVMLLLS